MNVVSLLVSHVEKVRVHRFLSSLTRKNKIYLFTSRFTIVHGTSSHKFRSSILVAAKGAADAESLAENRMKQILSDYEGAEGKAITIKMLKPRELTAATLHDESDGVLHLLETMRREASCVVSSVEKTESS